MNNKNNVLKEKSYTFALKIIQLYKEIIKQEKEFFISKKMLRSGTCIGAMIREAEYAQSKPDFIHKLSIALKEANETDYWLSLLKVSNYITQLNYSEMQELCIEIIKIIISSINTLKKNKE